jgi:hypothetical protein
MLVNIMYRLIIEVESLWLNYILKKIRNFTLETNETNWLYKGETASFVQISELGLASVILLRKTL